MNPVTSPQGWPGRVRRRVRRAWGMLHTSALVLVLAAVAVQLSA
jgi:hypothetical protein